MAVYDIPAIHGRGSYRADLQVNNPTIEVDLSGETMFLEIPAAHVRVALGADPNDPKQKLIAIPRSVVEMLPSFPTAYAVIDETDPIYPTVVLSGTISRNGYVGAPS